MQASWDRLWLARSIFPVHALARLVLFVLVLASVMLAACGSVTRSAEPGVVQVASVDAPAAPSDDFERGSTLYVRVCAGAPDAVLLAEPDKWSEVVALLEYAQPLRTNFDRSGQYLYVRAVQNGFVVEGWVWRSALSSLNPTQYPVDEDRWETKGIEYAESGKMSPPLPRKSGTTGADMDAVDTLEHVLSSTQAGSDSQQLIQRYSDFARDGGLIPD